MCRHFYEDFDLGVRIVRFHNIYGPYGTYYGGREKATAAISRNTAEAKILEKEKLKFGAMANRPEVLLLLMTVLREYAY